MNRDTLPSFSEIQDNFTILPNRLLDCLIDERLDTFDRNILLFIARQTYGWRCAFDHLTMADFAKTGISKTKALESLKKLEQLHYILVSRIMDAKKQQHKIYFINTDEAHRIIEFCKSGEMSYKELSNYRKLQIASKHPPCNGKPQYAENTPPVRVANPPRSCGEPLLNNSIKNSIKKQQASIPQTPLPESDVFEAVQVSAPDAAFFENAEPEPDWEMQPEGPYCDDEWETPEEQDQPRIPLLANPAPDAGQNQWQNMPGVQPPHSDAPPIAVELVRAGVKPDIAEALASRFPERCRQQLGWLQHRDGLSNPGGFLAKAIEQNFLPPPGVRIEQQQAQASDEQQQHESIVETVLQKAQVFKYLINRHGHKLEILEARKNGVLLARNFALKAIVNIPPETALAMQWEAA